MGMMDSWQMWSWLIIKIISATNYWLLCLFEKTRHHTLVAECLMDAQAHMTGKLENSSQFQNLQGLSTHRRDISWQQTTNKHRTMPSTIMALELVELREHAGSLRWFKKESLLVSFLQSRIWTRCSKMWLMKLREEYSLLWSRQPSIWKRRWCPKSKLILTRWLLS